MFIPYDHQQHLPKENTFDWVLDCQGKIHRHVKHRRTIETEIGGRRFFGEIRIRVPFMDGRAQDLFGEKEWRDRVAGGR